DGTASCDCAVTGGGGGNTGGGGGGLTGGGGGSTGGGGGTSIQPVSLGQFCNQYVSAACAHRVACGRYSDAGLDLCEERERLSLGDVCRRADAGYVQFDGVQAAQCLEWLGLPQKSCLGSSWSPCGAVLGAGLSTAVRGIFNRAPDACGAMTCATGTRCNDDCANPQCLGPLPLGASCSGGVDGLTRDCVEETRCDSADGGAEYTCLGALARGAPCGTLACNDADYCDFNASTPVCTARLPREAACTTAFSCVDSVCRSDRRCGALAAGARCVSGADCGNGIESTNVCVGLQVADGGLLDAGVCGPRPRLGEACGLAWAASFNPCSLRQGEQCLDGRCTRLDAYSRPEGAECVLRPWGTVAAPFYGFGVCAPGLACRPSPTAHAPYTGRCQQPLPQGSACRDEHECAPGLGCLSVADGGRQCERFGRLGEACTYGTCLEEFDCKGQGDGGSACVPFSALDAGCGGFGSCVPGATCNEGVCEPLSPAGAACSSEYSCASGVCQLGRCVDQCVR
ncbi:MAG TPA: hypothetical protein VGD87_06720, partial [Archangium sp.]